MSFPTYLRYEAVHVPVQIIHGENDQGLKKAAKQVLCTVHYLSPVSVSGRVGYLADKGGLLLPCRVQAWLTHVFYTRISKGVGAGV